MKVKELIERLKEFDPEAIVVVDGYETDYDVVKTIRSKKLLDPKIGDKPWYEGELIDAEDLPVHMLHDEINAVYLPRSS
jgi:hypothetical protein